MHASGGNQNLTSTDFNISNEVKAIGLDINDIVEVVNEGVVDGHETNTSGLAGPRVAKNAVLKGGIYMIYAILEVNDLDFFSFGNCSKIVEF